jgi:hypothetical protein
MPRRRHPSKEIEAAVREAETLGWSVTLSNGHAWGRLFCPRHSRNGCRVSIWSTPRDADNHAAAIRRAVSRCPHRDPEE